MKYIIKYTNQYTNEVTYIEVDSAKHDHTNY